MEFVQPIREKEINEQVKNELLKQGYRDYLIFVAGINTGLRISDLLELKVSGIRDKTHISIREEKMGKSKRFFINESLQNAFKGFIFNMDDTEYLFQSREGKNKSLTRFTAYRIINQACRNVGIKDCTGMHTLRKTFGYHHYQQFKDFAILQDIFNHSAPSVTLRHVGINDDYIDRISANFGL